MAKKLSWYDQGYNDGCEGICDAPYQPGNKHYDSYMEGNADGETFLWLKREREGYHGFTSSGA